jgi:hypothetical protein
LKSFQLQPDGLPTHMRCRAQKRFVVKLDEYDPDAFIESILLLVTRCFYTGRQSQWARTRILVVISGFTLLCKRMQELLDWKPASASRTNRQSGRESS